MDYVGDFLFEGLHILNAEHAPVDRDDGTPFAQLVDRMVRAIFKAWFVDCEHVRAKMEGRWCRGESLRVTSLATDLM